MKSLVLTLVGVCLLSGCQDELTEEEKLIAWNGVIRQGWSVSISHSEPGGYPIEVLSYANNELQWIIRDLTEDDSAGCFLVPQMYGYDIVLFSKKILTENAKREIKENIDKAIDNALKETESLRNNNSE